MKSITDNFPKITSRDNPKIKRARLARDGRDAGLIFIEGWRLCEEALRAHLKISEIFLTEEFARDERHRDFVQTAARYQLFEVSPQVFDSLSDTKTSQGVVVLAEKPASGKESLETVVASARFPLVVLLHEINNPANLGAILRVAEASGATGIVTTRNTTGVFSPKALRGSMGAAFRLPVWTNAGYTEALEWARSQKLKSVCADVRSRTSYTEIDWKIGRLLIIGSEGHGLTEEERRQADENLIVPMENNVESLNAAVACGIVLFEAKRQRDIKKPS